MSIDRYEETGSNKKIKQYWPEKANLDIDILSFNHT